MPTPTRRNGPIAGIVRVLNYFKVCPPWLTLGGSVVVTIALVFGFAVVTPGKRITALESRVAAMQADTVPRQLLQSLARVVCLEAEAGVLRAAGVPCNRLFNEGLGGTQ